MAVEQIAPAVVTKRRGSSCGTDDVGEHDRREHSLGIGTAALARDELLDLAEDGRGVADPVQGVHAGHLDVVGARDVLGEVPAVADRDELRNRLGA